MRPPPSLIRALFAVSFWAMAATGAVWGVRLFGVGLESVMHEAQWGGDSSYVVLPVIVVASVVLMGASVVVSGLWFLGGTVDRLGVRRFRRRVAIGVAVLAVATGPLIVGFYAMPSSDAEPPGPQENPFLTTSALHDSMKTLLQPPYVEVDTFSRTGRPFVRLRVDETIRRYEDVRRRAEDGTRLTVPALADTLHRLGMTPRPYRTPVLTADPSPDAASSALKVRFDDGFEERPRLRAYLSALARDLRQASWIELLDRVREGDAIALLKLDRGEEWPRASAQDDERPTRVREAAQQILQTAVDQTWRLDEGRASALNREAIRDVRFHRLRVPSDSTLHVEARMRGNEILPGRSSATLHVSLLTPSFRIYDPSLRP